MPLQNRVAPNGVIFADPARGRLMGNRGGQMHDGERRLAGRRWVSRAWIACTLQYKNRHEVIMAPGHYTQLFFLDEATALAAGHRPCALCRRQDFLRFCDSWQRAFGLARRPFAPEVDAVLHAERLPVGERRVLTIARIGELPDGAIFWGLARISLSPVLSGERGAPRLVVGGTTQAWTPSGYLAPEPIDPATEGSVLTPPSIIAIMCAGYAPMLDPSARVISRARS